MKNIKVSLDRTGFQTKPKGREAGIINNRIGSSVEELSYNPESIKTFAEKVGNDGHTFCPATFKDGKRSQENFEQEQFIALDFDNKDQKTKISFEEVKARADHYELPILFAYDTLSSTDHDKFRVVFLNDVPMEHKKVAEAMQLAMGTIFPEADSTCYKDVSKMYYGGKKLIYYDEKNPQINIESVIRNLTGYCKDKYNPRHYKEKLSRFSQRTGVALNENGFLDVKVEYGLSVLSTDNPTEDPGASLKTSKNGGNSPNPYIVYSVNEDGENPPKSYLLKFNEGTGKTSVGTSAGGDVPKIEQKNHKMYRSSVLSDMKECKLFNEYKDGSRDLEHSELFGLLTNLIQVETGGDYFNKIQLRYPEIYDLNRREKWKRDTAYLKQQNYHPQHCDGFCLYRNTCEHTKNILTTVHQRHGKVEEISGYETRYYSIDEVGEDLFNALQEAFHANDNSIHIIKSQTAAGKTSNYLKLMKNHSSDRFLIAAPTNLLKDEIYEKATKMGIKVMKTLSLQELEDEIPIDIWEHIDYLYKSGHYRAVHAYIRDLLEDSKEEANEKGQVKKKKKKNKALKCLDDYMKEREKIKKFHGSIITTHKYLLNMDEDRLKEFDCIIIDEDILFKGILSNQAEITVSDLKKIAEDIADKNVRRKIKELLKMRKKQKCIELDDIDWEEEDNTEDVSENNSALDNLDLAAFCHAENFYFREASVEENISKDTIMFIKPTDLKNIKYIIVSATANKIICQQYFEDRTIEFYECKKAKYEGTLIQHPQKSMSRRYLNEYKDTISCLQEKHGIPDRNVITYKNQDIGIMHYGNTEGSNMLEGQDILVVGTPNYPASLYKLVAHTMGIDFDEDEEMTPQFVTYKGFKFKITTFEDEDLRALHFWMLESELEQAVGRARLLRYDCTVHLYSNFPLEQAEFVYDE